MTEIGKGVHVTRTDTQDWRPDDEVGGSAHILVQDGSTIVGLWKSEPGVPAEVPSVELPARETLLILQGSVRIGIDGDEPIEFGPEQIVSLPKGAVIGWDPSPDCKVFWVYS